MTQEQYGMWLCSIEGIGSQTIRKLINRFGTPEEVYTRTEEQLKEAEIGDRERKLLINGKRQFRYRAMKQKISSYDMDVISYFSERYRKSCAIYRISQNGFIGGENFHVKNFRLQSWVQEIVRIMVVRWHADLRMNCREQA